MEKRRKGREGKQTGSQGEERSFEWHVCPLAAYLGLDL